jgi:hypothetical protein
MDRKIKSKRDFQVLNADVRPRSYGQVVHDAQAVSLQVSIVVATVEVFLLLQTRSEYTCTILYSVLAVVAAGQVLLRTIAGAALLRMHARLLALPANVRERTNISL